MAADKPARPALVHARAAEVLIENDPLPVRQILYQLIRAVVALALAVARLEDSSAGGR